MYLNENEILYEGREEQRKRKEVIASKKEKKGANCTIIRDPNDN